MTGLPLQIFLSPLLQKILCWAMLLHGAPAPTFPERISAIGSAKYSTAEQCSPRGGSEPLVEEDNPINSDRSKGKQGFGLISLEEGDRKGHHDLPSPGRERREANGVASTGSETSAVAGSLSVGSAGERDKGQNAGKAAGGIFSDEADDDDFFQSPQPGILETPLEQVVRMLEFIVERHDPKPQTKRALDKAIELLSLPENLNTVTLQSISHLEVDPSTCQWIEAQLQADQSVNVPSQGAQQWGVLRGRLTEARLKLRKMRDNPKEIEVAPGSRESGMSTGQLLRQEQAGLAYARAKHAAGMIHRGSVFSISQIMTLQARRDVMSAISEGKELISDKKDDTISGQNWEETTTSWDEINKVLSILPMWPGINPNAQKDVAELLTAHHFLDWNFDVFKLEELSKGHSLWYAGMLTLNHYNFIGVFKIDPKRLSSFLSHVEATYCFDPEKPNPYHTSVHAADVTLTVGHFFENKIISSGIKALQGFSLMIGAIVHDYRHMGVNNRYLVKVGDNLAVTYNDASMLENFHLAEAFRVLRTDKYNILEGLSDEEPYQFRQLIIKIVLATDLAHGFEYVSRFQASTNTKGGRRASIVPDMAVDGSKAGGIVPTGGLGGAVGGTSKDPLQAQILLMQMMIKVADVSHPTKSWDLHLRWTKLITEEFHRQGDLEIEKGVGVSPLCSRVGDHLPKSQCDFINFVARPCTVALSNFCREKTWVTGLEANYRRWEALAKEENPDP